MILDSSFFSGGETDIIDGKESPGSVPGVPGSGIRSFSKTDDSMDDAEGDGEDERESKEFEIGDPHPE
jgi:hypothetical protein